MRSKKQCTSSIKKNLVKWQTSLQNLYAEKLALSLYAPLPALAGVHAPSERIPHPRVPRMAVPCARLRACRASQEIRTHSEGNRACRICLGDHYHFMRRRHRVALAITSSIRLGNLRTSLDAAHSRIRDTRAASFSTVCHPTTNHALHYGSRQENPTEPQSIENRRCRKLRQDDHARDFENRVVGRKESRRTSAQLEHAAWYCPFRRHTPRRRGR